MLYRRSLLVICLIPSNMYEVEYYSVIKKSKIMPFAATCTDLETVMLNDVSWAEDKYHMIPLICGI